MVRHPFVPGGPGKSVVSWGKGRCVVGGTEFAGGRVVDGRGALVCVGLCEEGTGLGSAGAGTAAGLRVGACGSGFGAAVGSGTGAPGVVVGDGIVTGAVGVIAATKSTGSRATTVTADTTMASARTERLDSAAALAARL